MDFENEKPSEMKQSPIAYTTDLLGQNLSELSALMEALSKEIDPVLSPSEPAPEGATNTGPAHRGDSSIVNVLRKLNSEVAYITRMVKDLRSRVEL